MASSLALVDVKKKKKKNPYKSSQYRPIPLKNLVIGIPAAKSKNHRSHDCVVVQRKAFPFVCFCRSC